MQLDLLQKELFPSSQPASDRPLKNPDASPAAPIEDKAPGAFKTLSEAASLLGVEQHVLRFWESKFPQIRPLKRSGGRRYYRPEDMDILNTIKNLLYKQGYTIKGAKKAIGAALHPPKKPKAAKPPQPEPEVKRAILEQQKRQLAAIRQELVALREQLKPYLETK